MTITNVVLGFPERCKDPQEVLKRLNAKTYRYLGVGAVMGVRYYAVKQCDVPDARLDKCRPDFWKILDSQGDSLVYIEFGEAATAKIQKYLNPRESVPGGAD